jgi:hypothetical protein
VERNGLADAGLTTADDLLAACGSPETGARLWSGHTVLDGQVRDPAGLSVGEVHAISADIHARVRALLAGLHPAGASR